MAIFCSRACSLTFSFSSFVIPSLVSFTHSLYYPSTIPLLSSLPLLSLYPSIISLPLYPSTSLYYLHFIYYPSIPVSLYYPSIPLLSLYPSTPLSLYPSTITLSLYFPSSFPLLSLSIYIASAALTEAGNVYTWGDNRNGQLGHRTGGPLIPRLVEAST